MYLPSEYKVWLAAGLDGGDTFIKSNPSSSAKRKNAIQSDGVFSFALEVGFERFKMRH